MGRLISKEIIVTFSPNLMIAKPEIDINFDINFNFTNTLNTEILQ